MIIAVASYRTTDTRRGVGVLWDLTCFWPRDTHPFAPPCYTERIVPEVTTRMTAYLGEPDGGGGASSGVVLAAHSQGTVISVAVLLAQPEEFPIERVGLLTCGTVLDRLYARFFPRYFSVPAFERLNQRLRRRPAGPPAGIPRWVNLWRHSDYLGGTVPYQTAGQEAASMGDVVGALRVTFETVQASTAAARAAIDAADQARELDTMVRAGAPVAASVVAQVQAAGESARSTTGAAAAATATADRYHAAMPAPPPTPPPAPPAPPPAPPTASPAPPPVPPPPVPSPAADASSPPDAPPGPVSSALDIDRRARGLATAAATFASTVDAVRAAREAGVLADAAADRLGYATPGAASALAVAVSDSAAAEAQVTAIRAKAAAAAARTAADAALRCAVRSHDRAAGRLRERCAAAGVDGHDPAELARVAARGGTDRPAGPPGCGSSTRSSRHHRTTSSSRWPVGIRCSGAIRSSRNGSPG